MWRSRRWHGVGAVAVAVVGAAALAWPAVAAAGSAAVSGAVSGVVSATSIGPGTLTVSSSPSTVVASQPVTLTFVFTATFSPPPEIIVTLSMPAGWTAATPSPSDLTCLNSGCAPDGATSTEIGSC